MRNAASEEDVEFRTKVENPEKKERKWTWGDKCKSVHFPSKSVHFPSSEPREIPLETQLSFICSQIPLGKAESIFSFLWKYEGY